MAGMKEQCSQSNEDLIKRVLVSVKNAMLLVANYNEFANNWECQQLKQCIDRVIEFVAEEYNQKASDLEQKDIIALPRKCRTMAVPYVHECFGILYRDFPTTRIIMEAFVDEEQADAFLQKQEEIAGRYIYKELQEITDRWNTWAAKHRRGEHLTDLEVDEMLAAWDRKVELEKMVAPKEE